MKLAVIGLGRMGAAIAQRALNAHYSVSGYDPNRAATQAAEKIGVAIHHELNSLAADASIIWLMIPAGKLIDTVIAQLVPHLAQGTIIIDGGNSHYTDSMRRQAELALQGIAYLDCGTSGGVHGLAQGFCLMVGGSYTAYEKILPLLRVIACRDGVRYTGPSGSGHYVKMVHNGIEYGMLQAYAEGFQLLRQGDFKDLDLAAVAHLWSNGAVIRSWLLDLTHEILAADQNLASIDGKIQEGGTGAWMAQNAQKNKVPVPVLDQALAVRAQSRKTGGNFATKLIQMIRHAFGGHAIIEKKS